MFSRKTLTTGAVGNYSELLVASAYASEGYEVAVPFGGQSRWDLVVKAPGGGWRSIQVKTIAEGPLNRPYVIATTGSDGVNVPYSSADIDFIVAVHPESGTMWCIPPEMFDGVRRIPLLDDYIWRGGVARDPGLLAPGGTYAVPPRGHLSSTSDGVAARRLERRHIAARLPSDRPEWLNHGTLEMLRLWVNGFGYTTIARSYGIDKTSVRERISLALAKLGLKDLPHDMRQYSGPQESFWFAPLPPATSNR